MCKQQIHNTTQIMHGIRLWFLPGVAEITIELIPLPSEVRFGMEIKRTEEVRKTNICFMIYICVEHVKPTHQARTKFYKRLINCLQDTHICRVLCASIQ